MVLLHVMLATLLEQPAYEWVAAGQLAEHVGALQIGQLARSLTVLLALLGRCDIRQVGDRPAPPKPEPHGLQHFLESHAALEGLEQGARGQAGPRYVTIEACRDSTSWERHHQICLPGAACAAVLEADADAGGAQAATKPRGQAGVVALLDTQIRRQMRKPH